MRRPVIGQLVLAVLCAIASVLIIASSTGNPHNNPGGLALLVTMPGTVLGALLAGLTHWARRRLGRDADAGARFALGVNATIAVLTLLTGLWPVAALHGWVALLISRALNLKITCPACQSTKVTRAPVGLLVLGAAAGAARERRGRMKSDYLAPTARGFRDPAVLECGDSSPLLRRRLVAVKLPRGAGHASVPSLARAGNALAGTRAALNSTATSHLGKAVTSHRTRNGARLWLPHRRAGFIGVDPWLTCRFGNEPTTHVKTE
ncbi:hypothetical protein LBMAG56_39170 [Verrucomicrobiota bacterium]|nr:hypothetical protein LBMAG56_39170 [Verrucomicrobiota bacterium]